MVGALALCLIVAVVLSAVAALWFLVAAFEQGLGWGLFVLFVPFGGVLFAVTHWYEESVRWPFIASHALVAGMLVLALGTTAVDELFEDSSDDPQAAPVVQVSESEPLESMPSEEEDGKPARLEYDPFEEDRRVVEETDTGRPRRVEARRTYSLAEAGSIVGRTVVVKTSRDTFRGTLERANAEGLVVRTSLGGGSMSVPVPKADVQEIQLVD